MSIYSSRVQCVWLWLNNAGLRHREIWYIRLWLQTGEEKYRILPAVCFKDFRFPILFHSSLLSHSTKGSSAERENLKIFNTRCWKYWNWNFYDWHIWGILTFMLISSVWQCGSLNYSFWLGCCRYCAEKLEEIRELERKEDAFTPVPSPYYMELTKLLLN